MDRGISLFLERLVVDEIKSIVRKAASGSGIISASEAAAHVLKVYPGCGLDARVVADQVMMLAASAGVAVEFGTKAAAVDSKVASGKPRPIMRPTRLFRPITFH